MSLSTAMNFMDCYKNVLETLGDFDTWLGPNAKLFDLCKNSAVEDITLYEYIPFASYY